jgi:hypothetical protein
MNRPFGIHRAIFFYSLYIALFSLENNIRKKLSFFFFCKHLHSIFHIFYILLFVMIIRGLLMQAVKAVNQNLKS